MASSSNPDSKVEQLNGQESDDKAERRRRKEERKQEKRARKELKKLSKNGENGDLKDLPRRDHSRSRSPRFRSREQRSGNEWRPRIRSRTPPGERRNGPSRHEIGSSYGSFERERERENDRRRWDSNNARRDPPPDGRRF